MDYDTSAIRAAARKLDNIASSLESTRKSKINAVQSSINGLKGDTIKAIDDASDELSAELNSIRKGFANCADALYDFARRLDEADEKAKAMIGNN